MKSQATILSPLYALPAPEVAVLPAIPIGYDETLLLQPVNPVLLRDKHDFKNIVTRFQNGEMWPAAAPDPDVSYAQALNQFARHLEAARGHDANLTPAFVKQLYRNAVDVYDRYAHTLTDNFSATILGQEHLIGLTYDALQNGRGLPYSVSIMRNITSWNKLAGHTASDILKEAAFRAIEKYFIGTPGRICDMRRTHIGLQLSAAEFEARREMLVALPNLMPELIQHELKLWAQSANAPHRGKIKVTPEGQVEILGEKGRWIPFEEFSRKFAIGIAQVKLPDFDGPVHDFGSRVLIHNAAMRARNVAISRAEALSVASNETVYGPDAKEMAPSHFEFAQGVYVEPEDVCESLRELVGKFPALVTDLLIEMGITDGESLDYVLSWLTGDTMPHGRFSDAPKPIRELCAGIQTDLGRPAKEALSRFALQAGLIPRPQHELRYFSDLGGPLARLAQIANNPASHRNDEIAPLLPELEKLHAKAARARFELTNDGAIKKEHFEERALELMRNYPHTKKFHYLAIDIDHLRSFFTRYPLLVDQLVDFHMIRLQRLALVALEKYAASLGVDAEVPSALLKFGDEIIFLFPDTALNPLGNLVPLDRAAFDVILRRELDEAFGAMDFQIYGKVEWDHDGTRLPQYELTLKNGKSIPVYVQDVARPDGSRESLYWMQDPDGETWVKMRHLSLGSESLESFNPTMGKLGFTIAATVYEFDAGRIADTTIEELRLIREVLLDHTDAMKKRGGRGQTEEMEFIVALPPVFAGQFALGSYYGDETLIAWRTFTALLENGEWDTLLKV